MDLSKLPKLSNTTGTQPPPANTDIPDPQPAAVSSQPEQFRTAAIGLAETWISIGIGAFLLLIQPRFLQWLSSRIFHTPFNEYHDLSNNNVVPYTSVPDFWSDLGITLFGLVLIVDGLFMLSRRRVLYGLAFGLTLVATIYNLVYVAASYSSQGFAPISFLAVIFGGFITMTQWQALKNSAV